MFLIPKLCTECFDEPLGYVAITYNQLDAWLLTSYYRVSLYNDETDALYALQVCESTQETESISVPLPQKHLVITLAVWGSILNSTQSPEVVSKAMALMIESELSLICEPDSLEKFLVCVAIAPISTV